MGWSAPLGHGRAERQAAARRRHGRRDLQRLGPAQADRHGRGHAHDAQRQGHPADRVHRRSRSAAASTAPASPSTCSTSRSCACKDIKDLFFDTGMGSHAYSVIERSMVDNLLSDNTGHRRFLFEEASGITKYKQRKKEALNKLEATQTDLVRVTDLLVEIEREIGSLARQVAKARRYERLRAEIQDLDLRLSAQRHEGLIAREKELAEEHQAESVRREAAQTELDTRDAALQSLKIEQIEEERTLAAAQQALSEREAARASAQHEALVLTERGSGLSRRIEELDDELARATERLTELARAGGRRCASRSRRSSPRRRAPLVAGRARGRAVRDRRCPEGVARRGDVASSSSRWTCSRPSRRSAPRSSARASACRTWPSAARRSRPRLKLLATRLEQITADHAQAEADSAAHARSVRPPRRRAPKRSKRRAASSRPTAPAAPRPSPRCAPKSLRRRSRLVDARGAQARLRRRRRGGQGLLVRAPREGRARARRRPARRAGRAGSTPRRPRSGSSLQAVVFADGERARRGRRRRRTRAGSRSSRSIARAAIGRARRGAGVAPARGRRVAGRASRSLARSRRVTAPMRWSPRCSTGVFALEDEGEALRASEKFPEFTWVSRRGTVFARGLVTAGRAQDADRGLLRREHEIQALAGEKTALEATLAEAVAARTAWASEREGWQAESRDHGTELARAARGRAGARARIETLARERTQAESEQKTRMDETMAVAHDEAQVTESLPTLEAALAEITGRSTAQSGEAQSIEQKVAAARAPARGARDRGAVRAHRLARGDVAPVVAQGRAGPLRGVRARARAGPRRARRRARRRRRAPGRDRGRPQDRRGFARRLAALARPRPARPPTTRASARSASARSCRPRRSRCAACATRRTRWPSSSTRSRCSA